MRITFILPNVEISGGVKAVFEFANNLHDRGHNVCVLYPMVLTLPGAKQTIIELTMRINAGGYKCKQNIQIDWFDLKADLIKVPTLAERHIPDADIVVATWWATAYSVSRYSNCKGAKFYLAQHYEIWGGPVEKVNNSYKLGLRIIVNSTWLKNILQDKLKVEVEDLILHSPDLDQFYPEEKKMIGETTRILMPFRNIEWKGAQDGIKAFEIVRGKNYNVQLVMFGPASDKKVPSYVEFHEKAYKDKLREIYNSCDIFVFPSHVEGFGMPPMEAMLCKCAVVTTNVGAVPDYAIHGKTAMFCPPKAPEQLAENIIMLLVDPDLRKRIADAGYKHVVQNFSWDNATTSLEKLFERVRTQISRTGIKDEMYGG